MATDRKIEPKLAEAAAKTTAVLETLRSRLNREATPQEPPIVEPPEVPDELDRQLEQYFATAPAEPAPASVPAEVRIPAEIRAQVIDGVVDKNSALLGRSQRRDPGQHQERGNRTPGGACSRRTVEKGREFALKNHAGPDGTLQRNTSSPRVFTALVRRSASVLINA